MDERWSPPPQFDVDLSQPPAQRWQHIVPDYLEHMAALFVQFDEMACAELGPFRRIGEQVLHSAFRKLAPAECYGEVQGLAEKLEGTGWTVSSLSAFNVGYELVARCTSACLELPQELVVHLRNMDWEMPALRRCTLHVRFLRDEAEVFQAITWLGHVGVFTACRKGCASVSLNFRKTLASPLFGIVQNLAMLVRGGTWAASLLLRHVMESPDVVGFEEVAHLLRATPLMCPCYLIVAGVTHGQSTVIERDRNGAPPRIATEDGVAVHVATNCDFAVKRIDATWAAGDPLLLNSVDRRQQARDRLHSLLAELQEGGDPSCALVDLAATGELPAPVLADLFRVLEVPHVFNDQTIYSCVMVPALGLLRCKVWAADAYQRGCHTAPSPPSGL